MYGLKALRNLRKTDLFFCFKTPVLLQKFDRLSAVNGPEFVGRQERQHPPFPILAAVILPVNQ